MDPSPKPRRQEKASTSTRIRESAVWNTDSLRRSEAIRQTAATRAPSRRTSRWTKKAPSESSLELEEDDSDSDGSYLPGQGKRDSVYNLIRMREVLKTERDTANQDGTKVARFKDVITMPIHPENRYRMTWDSILLVLIFFMGITVPIDLGLVELAGPTWVVIEIFMITFFSTDIVLNFNSAFYDSYGKLESSRFRIAKQYLRSWFLLDFLSTFPFDMVLTASSFKGTSMMRLPRVVKIVRLARLLRLARVRSLLQKLIGLHLVTNMVVVFTVRFLSLFVALLLVTHWLACAFCAFAHWSEDAAVLEEVYGPNAGPMVGWEFDGVNALDMEPSRRYYAAFYFAFCSLQLLKPSDIVFRTSYCRYFFMLLGFIKPVVGASIMGVLTQMIVSNNNKRGTLQLKMQAIGVFMQKKRVPLRVQHQVLAYLEHAEKQMETLQDIDAIKTLSPTLRDEVAYNTNHSNICRFALFEKAFGYTFVRHLCSLLKLELFGPDDVICQEGHFITSMAFVNTGCLKLFKCHEENWQQAPQSVRNACSQSQRTYLHMGPPIELCGEVTAGSTLGAEALLWDTEFPAPWTALCFVFCELSTLKREDFLKSVERNPAWKETLEHVRTALKETNNLEPILASMASGDPHTMQAMRSNKKANKHQQKGPKSASLWHRAVKQIIKKRRQDSVAEELHFANHGIRALGEAAGATGHTLQTTGFASMQMTAVERHMVQEIRGFRRNLRDMFDNTEGRLSLRLDDAEDRLEAKIRGVETMLWTLVPDGPSEVMVDGCAPAGTPPARHRDVAQGGSARWVLLESRDETEVASDSSSSPTWVASI